MGCTASAQKTNTRPASPKDTPAVVNVETVEGNGDIGVADKVEVIATEAPAPEASLDDTPVDAGAGLPVDAVADPPVDTADDAAAADVSQEESPMEIKEIEKEDEEVLADVPDEVLGVAGDESAEVATDPVVDEVPAVEEAGEAVAEEQVTEDAGATEVATEDATDAVKEVDLPAEVSAPTEEVVTEATEIPEVEEVKAEEQQTEEPTNPTEAEEASPAQEVPVNDIADEDTPKEADTAPEEVATEAEKPPETTEDSAAEPSATQ